MHVAVTLSENNVSHYLNGAVVGACADSTDAPLDLIQTEAYINHGEDSAGTGGLDQIKIWNRALSAAEIAADYAATS